MDADHVLGRLSMGIFLHAARHGTSAVVHVSVTLDGRYGDACPALVNAFVTRPEQVESTPPPPSCNQHRWPPGAWFIARPGGEMQYATETQKAVIRRLFEEALNARRLEVLDEIVATDFVLHSAMLGEIRGSDVYRSGVEALLRASPDLHGNVESLLAAEDNHVIVRITYTGTDQGGFMTGRPGTGLPFQTTAIYIWRMEGNQIKELWQEADRARILQQLA
jgi:steroid delta-isomerase-like uncharacterized protein